MKKSIANLVALPALTAIIFFCSAGSFAGDKTTTVNAEEYSAALETVIGNLTTNLTAEIGKADLSKRYKPQKLCTDVIFPIFQKSLSPEQFAIWFDIALEEMTIAKTLDKSTPKIAKMLDAISPKIAKEVDATSPKLMYDGKMPLFNAQISDMENFFKLLMPINNSEDFESLQKKTDLPFSLMNAVKDSKMAFDRGYLSVKDKNKSPCKCNEAGCMNPWCNFNDIISALTDGIVILAKYRILL